MASSEFHILHDSLPVRGLICPSCRKRLDGTGSSDAITGTLFSLEGVGTERIAFTRWECQDCPESVTILVHFERELDEWIEKRKAP